MSSRIRPEKIPCSRLSQDETMKLIHQVTKTRTQVELAGVLGVKQSSISDAKRRGSIPDSWFIILLEREGINPFYLMYGLEPVHLILFGDDHMPMRIAKITPESADKLEDMVKGFLSYFTPPELLEEMQQTLSLRHFVLHSQDSLCAVLHKILPGSIASKIWRNLLVNFDVMTPSIQIHQDFEETLKEDPPFEPACG